MALKMLQNIAKCMAYIMDKSGGDFQKVAACTSDKPTSGIQWAPQYSWTSDRPQKQASEKADQSTFDSDVVLIS